MLELPEDYYEFKDANNWFLDELLEGDKEKADRILKGINKMASKRIDHEFSKMSWFKRWFQFH